MKQALSFCSILLCSAFGLFSPVSLIAQKRLTAQALYVADPVTGALRVTDSASYRYSGLRHSRFDANTLRYTDLSLIGSSPVADFISIPLPTNNIDSSELPLIDFDTAAFMVRIGSGAAMRSFEGRSYNAAGAYEEVRNHAYDVATGALNGAQRIGIAYASGRISRVYGALFNGSTYDTAFLRDFRYDVFGRLVLDSLTVRFGPGNFAGYARTVYTYGSGAGYLTATQSSFRAGPPRLVPVARTTNTYYPDGRVQTRYYEGDLAGGAFRPLGLDSFGYTAGVSGHTYLREQVMDTTGKVMYSYLTLASGINAAGQKDSVTYFYYVGDTLQDAASAYIEYDAGGYPLRRIDYELSTSGFLARLSSVEEYYYEAYGASAGVTAQGGHELSVYPNPTTGIIRIAGPGIRTGSRVRLVNAAGQAVLEEYLRADGVVSLGQDLPAGTYFLSITDDRGRQIGTKSVLKL